MDQADAELAKAIKAAESARQGAPNNRKPSVGGASQQWGDVASTAAIRVRSEARNEVAEAVDSPQPLVSTPVYRFAQSERQFAGSKPATEQQGRDSQKSSGSSKFEEAGSESKISEGKPGSEQDGRADVSQRKMHVTAADPREMSIPKKKGKQKPSPGNGESMPSAYYLEDDVQYIPSGKATFSLQRDEGFKGDKSGQPTIQDGEAEAGQSVAIRKGFSNVGKTEMESLRSKHVDQLYDADQNSDGSKPSAQNGASKDSNTAPAKGDKVALAELRFVRESESRNPRSVPLEKLEQLKRDYGRENLREQVPADPVGAEAYHPIFENAFASPAKEPQTTFSIDVDSASYANMRRFLTSGQVPPPDSIRIEELVNYFSYQYPVPQDGKPFSVNTDI